MTKLSDFCENENTDEMIKIILKQNETEVKCRVNLKTVSK